jgi:hypothetical protein
MSSHELEAFLDRLKNDQNDHPHRIDTSVLLRLEHRANDRSVLRDEDDVGTKLSLGNQIE